MNKGGRPTSYTEELGIDICNKIASKGAGIRTLCKENPHFPNADTIMLWLRVHPTFSERYHKAKKEQVTALVDEIIEISDDSSQDVIIKQDRDGNDYEVANTEFAARSRLRVDTRKWIAAKLVPRLYGDNAIARELSDEIEELKKLLEGKKQRSNTNGNVDDSDTEEDS